MSDSNQSDSSRIPDPIDKGIEGTQTNSQVTLVIPPSTAGGLASSPLTSAFEDITLNSPQKLGSMPTLINAIIQENMYEKRNLSYKLNECETKLSAQAQEIASLREKNAELRTSLNAESRAKLLRSASITGGVAAMGLGFKLTEKQEMLPVAVGLMLLGAAIAAFGWFSRSAKEVK